MLALTIGVLAFLKDRRVIWLLLLVVILLVLIPNPVRDGFLRAITADPYITMRPGIWGSAVSMTLDNPLVGSGPDNFRYWGMCMLRPQIFF